MRFCAVALLGLLAACQPSAPEAPTWFQDVQPLVMANCARCHGADPESPAIARFRLDRYVKNDPTFDAYDYREPMVRMAALLEPPAMPPTYALPETQRATLKRWLELGAPKGERSNRLPQIERLEPAQSSLTVDQSLALTFRAWDEDADGLTVRVGTREKGAAEIIPQAITGSGIRQVNIDTGLLPSGKTYEVVAVLDDGFSDDPAINAHPVVLLPDVQVDHGARGTAPSVHLLRPNEGGTLSGSAEITWEAGDPDPGDTVTISLELIEVATNGSGKLVQTIAPALTNVSSYTWDVSTVPATRGGQPIWYRVRAVARDTSSNVRSDESDTPFTIAGVPTQVTSYTWADVKPVFLTYCATCHGQPATLAAPESFRLDKYDASDPAPPVNADPGVYEMRARVYDRMVVTTTMPPAYATQPSAAEIAMIANWIEGGAPKGSGQ